jgi:hypothetical protein
MNYWLKSQGVLYYDNEAVRLKVNFDFVKYYKSLIDKEYRIFSNFPAHSAHITLFYTKMHGPLDPEKIKFLKSFYKKDPIEFEYDPNIQQGFPQKKYRNWYVWVRCPRLLDIMKFLGSNPGKGLHLTICNTKGGARPYIW